MTQMPVISELAKSLINVDKVSGGQKVSKRLKKKKKKGKRKTERLKLY